MTGDERDAWEERSSGGPDPRYVRRLEEDLRRSGEGSAHDRRARQSRSRVERAAAAGRRHSERRTARRVRRIAAAVFLVVAVLIAMVGLELKNSELGTGADGRSTPFSLVPFDTGGLTSTTEPAATSTTSTTVPATPSSTEPPATRSPATVAPAVVGASTAGVASRR